MLPEIDEYIRQGQARGWTRKTVESFRDRLSLFSKYVPQKRLTEIKPKDLDRFFERLSKQGWKRSSRKAVAQTLRLFFNWLVDNGKVLRNPTMDMPLDPDEEPELPPQPLSMDEVATLLDGLPRRNVIDLRNRAFLELLYGCGLRLNEALSLNLNDVDLTNRTLHVLKGKGGKQRDLPFGRGAILALRDYLALRRSLLRGPDQGVLFLSSVGRRVKDKAVWKFFEKLKQSNLLKSSDLTPHLLRHSIAVHLLQNGADVRYVQQFLGHSNLDTTKIYLRLVPGRLKEDYDKAMPEISVDG